MASTASIFRIGSPVLRVALVTLACLATPGSSAADAPFSAARRSVAEAADAQPMNERGHSTAGLASRAGQFDLECEGINHAFFDRPEHGVMDPPARPSRIARRYVVDLAARQFCDPTWCTMLGLARIPAIAGDRITLFDTRGPGDLTVEIFDRQTGRYVRRTHTIGIIWLEEGTCREVPFSAFRDEARDRLVSDRNATRDVAIDPAAVLLEAYRIWAFGIDRGIDRQYRGDRAEIWQFIDDARAVWAERLGRCTDTACEQQILADRVNRYNYSIGQPVTPIPGSPWESGLVRFEAGPTSGRLSVFPIVDDRLLVRVAAEDRRTGMRCDMTAEGRFVPGGSIEMEALDDRRTGYRFYPASAGGWTFEPTDTGDENACQTMANLLVTVSNVARNLPVETY